MHGLLLLQVPELDPRIPCMTIYRDLTRCSAARYKFSFGTFRLLQLQIIDLGKELSSSWFDWSPWLDKDGWVFNRCICSPGVPVFMTPGIANLSGDEAYYYPVYSILLAGMKNWKNRLHEAKPSSYLLGNTAGKDGMSRPESQRANEEVLVPDLEPGNLLHWSSKLCSISSHVEGSDAGMFSSCEHPFVHHGDGNDDDPRF